MARSNAAGAHQKSVLDPRGLSLSALESWVKQELDLPTWRARQIFAWIHGRTVTSVDAMTNLSKELRRRLAEKLTLMPLAVDTELATVDGTRKLRLRCTDDATIETVLIPEEGKLTQCLSTQVGCGLGCRFCATATMGLRRNLLASEIVQQVYVPRQMSVAQGHMATMSADPHPARLSNLVFMGMGEPMNNLDQVLTAIDILCTDLGVNLSPRRITISTAGVVPGIQELGRRARQVGLAISLNATTDDVRDQLMPINRRWPLAVLLEAVRRYPLPRRRRITFEYVLVAGINDSRADARRLPRLIEGIPAKVNLIPYNPVQNKASYGCPSIPTIETFADQLREKGLTTFIRKSKGREIAAACGQLVIK